MGAGLMASPGTSLTDSAWKAVRRAAVQRLHCSLITCSIPKFSMPIDLTAVERFLDALGISVALRRRVLAPGGLA